MSVVWMETWSQFRDFADLEARYSLEGNGALAGNNIEILPAGGPTLMPSGAQSPRSPAPGCLRIKGNLGTEEEVVIKIPVASKAEYIIGFNLQLEGWNPAQIHNDDTFLILRDDVGNFNQLSFEFNFFGDDGDPNLAYFRADLSTNAGTFWDGENDAEAANDPSFHAIELGRWYYIEIHALINNGAGSIEFRVDGETWFKTVGVDTSIGGGDVIDEIWITSAHQYPTGTIGSGSIYRITDVIVIDPTVAGHQKFPYPAIIDVLYASAETAQLDFTPQSGPNNALMVDEVQQDLDTTWNEADTAADKDRLDTFTASVPESLFGDVLAVQVLAMVKDTADLGTRTFRVVIFEGATEGVGTTRTLTESQFQAMYHIYETNPDTSAAWLMADVEGSEIGYEIIS